MNNPLLNVKNLKVHFPVYKGLFRKVIGYVKAVDDISLELYPKEVLGIVGESGSGKSTLVRAIAQLIPATSGEMIFNGEPWGLHNPATKKNAYKSVQIVFQDPMASLNPRKPVGESIGEALLYHGIIKTREEQGEHVATIIEKIGLNPEMMSFYPHEFSGGQLQRICIGRAIILQPKLIICDEAVSALDVSVQSQILNLLTSLKTTFGFTYLFISHDLSVIRLISDRVIVMYLGKVMEEAPTDQLFSNPKHPYTQALLSAIPKSHPKEKKERIALKGEIPSPRNPPSGCPFRTRCPYAQPICAEPPPKKVQIIEGKERHYFCILD